MNTSNQNKSPFGNQSSKPRPIRQNQNFAEALKSIGGSVVNSVKQDIISGTSRDVLNSFTGGSNPNIQPRNTNFPSMNPGEWGNPSMGNNSEWLKQRENAIRAQEKAKRRHQEVMNAQPLFDRRNEEVKAQIKTLQDELRLLAKDMASLSSNVQRAVEEEIVHPGTYHLNFFESLKRYITFLRRQVSQSQNWLELGSQRKKAKNHYWGNVKKSGTKYMLSQERTLQTQTG